MKFGLSTKELSMICEELQRYPEIKDAKIFGSRAMGIQRKNSDIDIVLWGKIDEGLLAKISSELDELALPYLFDIILYSGIKHPELHEHIDKFAKNICNPTLI